MLNLNSIMVNTEDVQKLAKFYEEVFGKSADMAEGDYHGWKVGSTFFTVAAHSEIKGEAKDEKRILLNFETSEVKEEFERISKIKGVTVIKEPYTMEGMSSEGGSSEGENAWIATLADPDGNLFQLVTPWEM